MTLALVAGAVANKPRNGGAAWTRLSWALGMRQLGFAVHFVERLAYAASPDHERWFTTVMHRHGFGGSATLLRADGTTAYGLSYDELVELAAEASVLVNISGHVADPAIVERVKTTVFIDLDPGYTQSWYASGFAELPPHDHWYTVGTNVGTEECSIPTGGIGWRPTLQPVVLDEWPAVESPATDRFTTVAAWRGSYGPIEHEGRLLGPKAHEFRRFVRLPLCAPASFELALDIHPDDDRDRAALEDSGWSLVEAREVAKDPDAFRAYVQGSGAELSVAQAVYTHTSSGWFSDRTARYLATGRPAIVQDTAASRTIPTGDGLLVFRSLAEAVDAVRSVIADYASHSRSARRLAEDYLASDVVLGRICEAVGVAP